jgi:hypothetical protein
MMHPLLSSCCLSCGQQGLSVRSGSGLISNIAAIYTPTPFGMSEAALGHSPFMLLQELNSNSLQGLQETCTSAVVGHGPPEAD